MDVRDSVCIVTGGAQGTGLGLCTRFAQEGAHVVLSGLRRGACDRAAAPIGAYPVAADVGREEDVPNLVSSTVERFGRIDLFGCNAGIAVVVHLAFLTGFNNRLSALANWTVTFIGRGRRQRTKTRQQALARTEGLQLTSGRARDRAHGLLRRGHLIIARRMAHEG